MGLNQQSDDFEKRDETPKTPALESGEYLLPKTNRRISEDAVIATENGGATCDGVGGEKGGGLAAREIVKMFQKFGGSLKTLDAKSASNADYESVLKQFLQTASLSLLEEAPKLESATTANFLWYSPDSATMHIAVKGDGMVVRINKSDASRNKCINAHELAKAGSMHMLLDNMVTAFGSVDDWGLANMADAHSLVREVKRCRTAEERKEFLEAWIAINEPPLLQTEKGKRLVKLLINKVADNPEAFYVSNNTHFYHELSVPDDIYIAMTDGVMENIVWYMRIHMLVTKYHVDQDEIYELLKTYYFHEEEYCHAKLDGDKFLIKEHARGMKQTMETILEICWEKIERPINESSGFNSDFWMFIRTEFESFDSLYQKVPDLIRALVKHYEKESGKPFTAEDIANMLKGFSNYFKQDDASCVVFKIAEQAGKGE
jgi:hypothetical protein